MLSELEVSKLIVRQHICRLNKVIISEENRLNSIQIGLNLAKEICDTAKQIMDKAILKAEKLENELKEKEVAMTCSDKKPEHAALLVKFEESKADETEARQNHAQALRKYNEYKEESEKCNTVLKDLKFELDKSTTLQSNLSLSWSDNTQGAHNPLSSQELMETKETFLKIRLL